jgi:hypothetical protein
MNSETSNKEQQSISTEELHTTLFKLLQRRKAEGVVLALIQVLQFKVIASEYVGSRQDIDNLREEIADALSRHYDHLRKVKEGSGN